MRDEYVYHSEINHYLPCTCKEMAQKKKKRDIAHGNSIYVAAGEDGNNSLHKALISITHANTL